MNIIKQTLLMVFMFGAVCGVATAEDNLLKREQIMAFIGSYDVLRPLSEEMKAAGVTSFFKHDPQLMAKKDMPLYTENIRIMQENTPQYYDRLVGVVTNYSHDSGENSDPVYRFSSAKDWARVGDRIMIAYFTENSTASNTAYDDFMAAMPPGMLDMLKPKERAKVQQQLDMMRSAQNVPEGDKKLVDTFKDDLGKVLIEAH